MKKKLLYSILILFGLNSLYAFNPFTSVRNLAAGERKCQPSLAQEIEKGLPEYKRSHNSPHAHVVQRGKKALDQSQALERKMLDLIDCIGKGSRDTHENHMAAAKLAKNHPKFTEALAPICHRDTTFKQMFSGQCTIAMLADSSVKNKGKTSADYNDSDDSSDGSRGSGRRSSGDDVDSGDDDYDNSSQGGNRASGSRNYGGRGNYNSSGNGTGNDSYYGASNQQGNCPCTCPSTSPYASSAYGTTYPSYSPYGYSSGYSQGATQSSYPVAGGQMAQGGYSSTPMAYPSAPQPLGYSQQGMNPGGY